VICMDTNPAPFKNINRAIEGVNSEMYRLRRRMAQVKVSPNRTTDTMPELNAEMARLRAESNRLQAEAAEIAASLR